MCAACRLAATTAANAFAAVNSARLAGHGRQPHGRDAGRARGNAARDVDTAWQRIYDQTLNRLQALPACADNG